MVLENLGRALEEIFRKLKRLSDVDKESIDAVIKDLQRALLSADVKVELVFQMTEKIKKIIWSMELNKIKRKEYIIKLIHDELVHILGGTAAPLRIKYDKKNIVLLVGIQGSGKTTTVGKLSNYYKSKGHNVAAITTDTWRPGAYEQLVQLTNQIGVKTYGNPEEKNALKIASKEIKKAFDDGYNLLIVDTAGRNKEEKELMVEMVKIEEVVKPDEVILVIDGSLGQQAYSQ